LDVNTVTSLNVNTHVFNRCCVKNLYEERRLAYQIGFSRQEKEAFSVTVRESQAAVSSLSHLLLESGLN